MIYGFMDRTKMEKKIMGLGKGELRNPYRPIVKSYPTP
jgi:hypothetical protein